MDSSRFFHKHLIASLIICLMPLSIFANLQTEYIGADASDSGYAGVIPLLVEEPGYTDYVEQTYPIDDNYNGPA